MAKQHAPRFLQVVEEARTRITEWTIHDVKGRLESGETFHLIDVREESEFARGRLPQAIHVSKGVIERDIEQVVPQTDAVLVLYCGGGYRSALAAEALLKMGYTNVISMDGGWREWTEAGYPTAIPH